MGKSKLTINSLNLFFSLLVLLAGCSKDDGGEGKDEKGKDASRVAPASGVVTQAENNCSAGDALRNQCYQELLRTRPDVVNELQGANPILLRSWDAVVVEKSRFALDIMSCRTAYPDQCLENVKK